MRILFASLAALIALTGAAEARPYNSSKSAASSSTTSATDDLAIYAGQFSSFRSSQYESAMGGLEYRFKDQFNGLRPTIGVMGNTDGAVYGYAGAYWDLPLNTAPFVISPGFAVGGYHQGSSKDLGYGLEFRSTLEVTYKFDDGQRVGAQIAHLSNASIGDSNPGVETLEVVYSHPLGW